MNDNELREWMQRPVEIPALVQKKKESAIARIREDAGVKREDGSVSFQGQKRKKLWKKASLMVAAALAICVIAWAAESNWGQFLVEKMRVTEEQQSFLEKEGFANAPNVSEECNGVTITVRRTITDCYQALIDLKVEGYTVPEGETPAFGKVGSEIQSISAWMDRGKFLNNNSYLGDNSNLWGLPFDMKQSLEDPLDKVEEDEPVSYVTEDGSLEYLIHMRTTKPGSLVGAEIDLTLEDLGIIPLPFSNKPSEDLDLSSEHMVRGTWSLHFQLAGNDSCRKVDATLPYDDLGYRITNVEIAPLSMTLDYEMEKNYREVNVIGVQMKDGTLVKIDKGMGIVPEDNIYARNQWHYFAGVIDPEEVDAILVRDERRNADNDLGYLVFPVE